MFSGLATHRLLYEVTHNVDSLENFITSNKFVCKNAITIKVAIIKRKYFSFKLNTFIITFKILCNHVQVSQTYLM